MQLYEKDHDLVIDCRRRGATAWTRIDNDIDPVWNWEEYEYSTPCYENFADIPKDGRVYYFRECFVMYETAGKNWLIDTADESFQGEYCDMEIEMLTRLFE